MMFGRGLATRIYPGAGTTGIPEGFEGLDGVARIVESSCNTSKIASRELGTLHYEDGLSFRSVACF